MKTEISRNSHQPGKRYSGVYQQQGRMLTDADWNELVDILKDRLNEALKDVVGSKEGSIGGTPRHRALRVIEDSFDVFKIYPGHIYVDGMVAQLPGKVAFAYDAQEDFPSPLDPTGDFVLYADIWERTVTHLMDERLRDKGLHGADTCTRKQVMTQVKWCAYDTANPAAPGNDPERWAKNPGRGDAPLSVTLQYLTIQPDSCDPCAAQLNVDSRAGNYLFRMEVHDVKGDANDPTEVTLKWSSENGAEQYALKDEDDQVIDTPESFKSGKWAYEFFDEDGEKHLGVHLVSSFTPSRGELYDGYPSPVPTRDFTRRWDGFCTLTKSGANWTVALDVDGKFLGWDRGIRLQDSDSGAIGYVSVGTDTDGLLQLQILLANTEVKLNFEKQEGANPKETCSFVAGDYWLADVREAEHDPLDAEKNKLLVKEPPLGIEHHYLTLGKVVDTGDGSELQPNPEADRKYAFPPLTEMTRMFHVGGDGQEAMPGNVLPQPLEVGVANGEWLVEGVTVRFSITTEQGGALSLTESFAVESLSVDIETDSEGIARCYWQLGDGIAPHDEKQRLKAELIDRDGNPLDHPPLYFNANLSAADQVAYDPGCRPGTDTVHQLLVSEIVTPPNLPTLGTNEYYTVKEVLDALLCRMMARHIPYDPTQSTRWGDINDDSSRPGNVQDALDDLVDNLESSDIRYILPDCEENNYGAPTVKSYIEEDIPDDRKVDDESQITTKVEDLWTAILCHLDAARIPYNPKLEDQRWSDILDQADWNSQEIIKHADWIKQYGDSANDYLHGLAVDADGNVLLSGTFSGTINFGGTDLPSVGDATVFLAKLNSKGGHVWSDRIGVSRKANQRQALTVDRDGNAILVARYKGSVDLGDPGVFECEPGMGTLIAKFSKDDGQCDWAQFLGSPEPNPDFKVAVDPFNNIFVSGFFSGTMDIGEESLVSKGNLDSYLVKYLPNGDVRACSYGGPAQVACTNMAINSQGNIVVTGTFREEINFGEPAPVLESTGGLNIFLAEFDNNGDYLWADQYGSATSDYVEGLALDSDDNIYLTGTFEQEINFGSEEDNLIASDGLEIFIAKFTSKGEHILSRAFTGPRDDLGYAISVSTNGTIALAGRFESRLSFGGDELDLHGFGFQDGYFALLNADLVHLYSEITGGGNFGSPKLVAGQDGTLVLGNIFLGNIDVAGQPLSSSGGPFDLFVARFDLTTNFPFTVQAAIDALISELESSDIAYKIPSCNEYVDSLRQRLLPAHDSSTIREILDELLCKLDASNIPYDRNTDSGSLRDAFLYKEGAQTITGPLTIDDGTGTPLTTTLLDVKGKVKANSFEGDGSALEGISAGKWSDGADGKIYYNSGYVGIGVNNPRLPLEVVVERTSNNLNPVAQFRATGPSQSVGSIRFVNTNNNYFSTGITKDNDFAISEYKKNISMPNDYFRITRKGKVGIGTNSKLSTLTVSGKGFDFNKTGTVEVTEGSLDVTGTGTLFLSEVGIGDPIYVGVAGETPAFGVVTEITSNTALKVHAPFSETKNGNWFSISSLFRAESPGLGTGRVIISPFGSVLINTLTTSYALHTNGTSYAKSRAGDGFDYAEYFESLTKKSIPIGSSVVIESGKIRSAKKGEIPFGVISGNPIITGGVHAEWPKKYFRNEYGSLIMEEYQEEVMVPKKEVIKKERQKIEIKKIEEEVARTEVVYEKKKYRQKEIIETVTREEEILVFKEVNLYDEEGKNKIGKHKIPVMETYEEEIEVIDDEGNPVLVGTGKFETKKRPKLNPEYDESKEYIPREKRPEWNCVGLLGQLSLRKRQPVAPGWIKIKDISDDVELWLVK